MNILALSKVCRRGFAQWLACRAGYWPGDAAVLAGVHVRQG